MSNVDELPDLAGDVRDRTVTPPYDTVTRRLRARRRRSAAGVLAATVLVGGLAVWQDLATSASPDPAPPASQGPPTVDTTWQELVASELAHPFAVSGTDDGAIAVVWRDLIQPQPAFAIVVREADGTVHGRLLDEPVTLTPVPGGWAAVSGSLGWFLSSDGTWSDLGRPGPPRTTQPGDVLVVGQLARWVFRSSDRTWATTSVGSGDHGGGYVTTAGRYVGCRRSEPRTIGIYRDGVRVAEGSGGSCVVAGHGDHVVVVLTGDAPDGSIPIREVVASDDGGATWSTVPFAPGSLNSVAVLADGTPVVGTDDGALTVGASQSGQEEHGTAFAAGQRVYSLAFGRSKGPLLASDDDGGTWHETTLPGLE